MHTQAHSHCVRALDLLAQDASIPAEVKELYQPGGSGDDDGVAW